MRAKRWTALLLAVLLAILPSLGGMADGGMTVPADDGDGYVFYADGGEDGIAVEAEYSAVEEELSVEEEPLTVEAAEEAAAEEVFAVEDGVLLAYHGAEARVTVPEGVRRIGEKAFAGNEKLEEITLPDTVEEIGEKAFAGCAKLKKVTAKGLKVIGSRAFMGCALLEDRLFAKSAEEVAEDAFDSAEESEAEAEEILAEESVEALEEAAEEQLEQAEPELLEEAMESAAPAISTQPSNQAVLEGDTVTFTVKASGASSYQWQYMAPDGTSWHNLSEGNCVGTKTASLSFTATAGRAKNQYRCMVENADGTTYSSAVTVTIVTPITITAQPQTTVAAVGGEMSFSVQASGATAYQWQYMAEDGDSWHNLSEGSFIGTKTPSLSFTVTAARAKNQYRCVLRNALFTEESSPVSIDLLAITQQPQSVTAGNGTTVVFTVKAENATGYMWQWNSGNGVWHDSSTLKPSLSIVADYDARNGFSYRCVVSANGYSVYSNAAKLTVVPAPVITQQPSPVSGSVDDTVTFTVKATGATGYQWQYFAPGGTSWHNLSEGACTGTKTAAMSFPLTAGRAKNQYRCVVTGAGGSTPSDPVMASIFEITQQPQSLTLNDGETATFTVKATGAVSYLWQWNGGNGVWHDTGTKTASLSILADYSARNGFSYRCVLTAVDGKTLTSGAAKLTIRQLLLQITGQPQSVTLNHGDTASFTVTAENAASYLWQWSSGNGIWTNTSTTTPTLTIAADYYARNGFSYRCIVTGVNGDQQTSSAAKLTIREPLAFTQQPGNVTVAVNETAVFTAKVNRSDALYQWQYDGGTGWKNLTEDKFPGATSVSVRVQATTGRSGFKIRCRATTGSETVFSNTVVLKANPIITKQPQNIVAAAGKEAFFGVTATGATAYQWQYSTDGSTWKNLAEGSFTGTQTRKVTFTLNASRAANYYRCVVSNAGASVNSSAARASLLEKPVITRQPANVIAVVGQYVSFTVQASGADSYQWQYMSPGGTSWHNLTEGNSVGTKTATLSFSVTAGRAGNQYRCRVTNAAGSVYSDAAGIILLTPPVITSDPSDVTVSDGQQASFTAYASDWDSLQWQCKAVGATSWTNITSSAYTGAQSSTLTFTAYASMDGYQYRLAATNAAGTTYSKAAELFVSEPLRIVTQPSSLTNVVVGDTAMFRISAIGATSYQWQYMAPGGTSWHNLSEGNCVGTKTDTLSFPITAGRAANSYRCVVSNGSGSLASNAVTLTMLEKPVITSHPASKNVNSGTSVSFTAKATGATSYQWQYRTSSSGTWTNYSGATSTTLTLTAYSSMDGYQYRLSATNRAGTTYSSAATLNVAAPVSLPVITKHPSSVTAVLNGTVSFSVTATGATGYQWQYLAEGSSTWRNLSEGSFSGTKTSTLTFEITISSRATNKYRCMVSNSAGSVYSNAASITLQSKPTITSHPVSVTTAAGNTVTFSAGASGATSYRWQYNAGSGWNNVYDGSVYSGTTTTRLSFTAVTSLSGIQYRLSATNAAGTSYSNAATFTLKQVDKPVFTSHPSSVTTAAGNTVTFSASATGATSYRWQYNAGSGWKDVYDGSVYSGTTTTRLSFTAATSLSGIQYRLSATNAGGTSYSNAATFTTETITVTISRSSATIKNGASLTLTANTSVTWSSSNTGVATVSSSGVVFGKYPGTATITASNGTSSATCRVTVQANYRALLISESTFWWETIIRNQSNVNRMKNLLQNVHGPDGGSYAGNITTKDDLTTSEVMSWISTAFSGARDGDVSLFMIASHGDTSCSTNHTAGSICTYWDGDLYLDDLAIALAKIPGKVIVILQSCGSGAATRSFSGAAGSGAEQAEDDRNFGRLAISAFAGEDPGLTVYEYEEAPVGEGFITVPEPETNEFLDSKFVILTAASYHESSWSQEGETLSESFAMFVYYMEQGITTSGSFPADTQYGNGDGRLTLKELHTYLLNTLGKQVFHSEGKSYTQTPTIYPSNGSYVLFIR